MTKRTLAAALLLAMPLSSILVACGNGEDTSRDRQALEREALERDLDLALRPEPTAAESQTALSDVPVTAEAPEPEAPAFTPPPAAPPRREPAPPRAERPRERDPEPEPIERPAPEPERPRFVTRTAPAGSTFSVRIDEELSAKQDGVGSSFTATLSEPLVTANGTTVIPAGATVNGRITSVGRESIGVTFTSISSGGETYPIDATVVDYPATRRVNRTGRGETAAKVAGGGAIGAVAGRVLGGDRRSAIAGAAIGAAAGTAAAIATANVDTVVDAGSSATVRLDSSVSVRREQ